MHLSTKRETKKVSFFVGRFCFFALWLSFHDRRFRNLERNKDQSQRPGDRSYKNGSKPVATWARITPVFVAPRSSHDNVGTAKIGSERHQRSCHVNMFENEVTGKATEDDGKLAAAYDDEGRSVRRRHRNHGNDRDKKQKKLPKSPKQCHGNSSDHAHKYEQIRKRRHSKKSEYRHSDEEDDDNSHLHVEKSKKKGHKKHKKSERRRDKNDNEPMVNNKILRNDQTIDTNPTTTNNDLPQNAACRREDTNTDHDPVRRTPPMIPMTRQQYEQEQSQIRSVYDPVSGRVRQIRGSGEIIETIVTRSQHTRINQIATQTDGQHYSQQVWNNAARHKR